MVKAIFALLYTFGVDSPLGNKGKELSYYKIKIYKEEYGHTGKHRKCWKKKIFQFEKKIKTIIFVKKKHLRKMFALEYLFHINVNVEYVLRNYFLKDSMLWL